MSAVLGKEVAQSTPLPMPPATAQANPLQSPPPVTSGLGGGGGGGGGYRRQGSVLTLLDGLNVSGLKEGDVEEAALAISEGLCLDSACLRDQQDAPERLSEKDLKAALIARGVVGLRAGGVAAKVRKALAESLNWESPASALLFDVPKSEPHVPKSEQNYTECFR